MVKGFFDSSSRTLYEFFSSNHRCESSHRTVGGAFYGSKLGDRCDTTVFAKRFEGLHQVPVVILGYLSIVQNKRAIERLTLQLFDDVDIEAAASLALDAGDMVVIDTTGDFRLDHVKVEGDARLRALVRLVRRLRRPGIVYCTTTREVDEVYTILRRFKVPATRYHGKMTATAASWLSTAARALASSAASVTCNRSASSSSCRNSTSI